LIASSTATVASTGAYVFTPRAAASALGESTDIVTLNSKNKKAFPLASFGLQVYDDDTAYRLTLTALEVGYRNFFASVLAGNQRGFAKVNSR
jgi:asparagine synthetase A